MNYDALKQEGIRGWHTWNVRSVLSHVLMPRGLGVSLMLKEYMSGQVLSEALIGRIGDDWRKEEVRPLAHSFDGSYTRLRLLWCGIDLDIETASEGEELFILVTPLKLQQKTAMLIAEVSNLWNGEVVIRRDGGKIFAEWNGGLVRINIAGEPVIDKNIPAKSPYLSAALTGEVAVCTGEDKGLAEIRQVIASAREKYEARGGEYGALQDMYKAIECAVSWDTIYEPNAGRVISPVCRLWSLDHGGWAMFCWDNFFAGFMASLYDRLTGYSNLIEMLSERTEGGFVPNYSFANGVKSLDRSQPPVGSAMLREVYRLRREKWLIEKMLPDLYEWNGWFECNRMNDDGTLSWGSNPVMPFTGNYTETNCINRRFGAALESGLDNSPMYDDIPFDSETHRLKLADVGLTGLFILDCQSLMDLCPEVGEYEKYEVLKKRLARAESGLETLWDEENGFYYNRRTDTNEFSRRVSPTNFYALFSKNIPEGRARRMADEHYFNPEEFYGD